jgi:hypothetical protein
MDFLQSWTLLELQKSIDQLLAVVEDRPQFPSGDDCEFE